MTAVDPTPVPAPRRTRGRRKPGAASSVVISGDTADRLDALVSHFSQDFTVTRAQVVEKAVRALLGRVTAEAGDDDRVVRAAADNLAEAEAALRRAGGKP